MPVHGTGLPADVLPYCYASTAFLYLDTPDGQGARLPGRDDLLCWYRTPCRDHDHLR